MSGPSPAATHNRGGTRALGAVFPIHSRSSSPSHLTAAAARPVTLVLPRPSPPSSGPDLLLTASPPPDLRFYPIHFLGCGVNLSGGTGVSWDSPPEFLMARTKNCGPDRPEPSSRGMDAISLASLSCYDQIILGFHYLS